MQKLDFKKQYKNLYNPGAKTVTLVDVPPLNFIMIDGMVPAEMEVEDAADLKKKKDPALLDRARFETFHEGRAVQILHLGPFSEEPANIARLVAFSAEHGYQSNGKHHEVYLSDPRRTAPDKLRTVLRHPVR